METLAGGSFGALVGTSDPGTAAIQHHYDLGGGRPKAYPFVGRRAVRWISPGNVAWSTDASSAVSSAASDEPSENAAAGPKAKKAKGNADDTDAGDNWLGRMYPCIELFITEADGIVEFGVAAGWDKKTSSITAFNQGGNYGETLWREGWQLCDALVRPLRHQFTPLLAARLRLRHRSPGPSM